MQCGQCQRVFNNPSGICPFCGLAASKGAESTQLPGDGSFASGREQIGSQQVHQQHRSTGSGMMGSSSDVVYVPAGFWLRVLACMIDGWIVWLLQVIMFSTLLIAFGGSLYFFGANAQGSSAAPYIIFMIFAGGLVIFLLTVLYYVIFECSSFAATPGKMLLGLSVTDTAGDQISFWRSLGRQAGKFISSLILGIGYLMAGFTEHKQALHDKLASCLVVYDPRTPVWRIFFAVFLCVAPFFAPSMIPPALMNELSKAARDKKFNKVMPQSDTSSYRSIKPTEVPQEEELVPVPQATTATIPQVDLAPSPNFASIGDVTADFQSAVAFLSDGKEIVDIGLFNRKLSSEEVAALKQRGSFDQTTPDLKVTIRFGWMNPVCDSKEISTYVISFQSSSPIFRKTVQKDALEFARAIGASRNDQIALNCERTVGSTFSAVIRGEGVRRNPLGEEKVKWDLAFQTELFKKQVS